MRFFSLVIALAMASLSLAAPVAVPEPQGGAIAADSACANPETCYDFKREA
jgi:hypothetical protein